MKNLIDNLPKYLVLAALLGSAASFVHEFGFYSSLGLQLHEIPFTPTDQLKNWLVLIPAALGLITAIPYVQTVFFAVMEDREKAKKYSTNTTKWKRLTPKIRFWTIVLFLSSIFLIFASTSSSLYLAVFWLAFGLFLRFVKWTPNLRQQFK